MHDLVEEGPGLGEDVAERLGEVGRILVDDRLEGGLELVEPVGDTGENLLSEAEDGRDEDGAESRNGGVHILKAAGGGLADLVRGVADLGSERGLEVIGVDLTLLHHVGELVAGDAVDLLEALPDRNAPGGDLIEILGVRLALGAHLIHDQAQVREGDAGHSRGVGVELEVVGELLAWLDAGRDR